MSDDEIRNEAIYIYHKMHGENIIKVVNGEAYFSRLAFGLEGPRGRLSADRRTIYEGRLSLLKDEWFRRHPRIARPPANDIE